ncbi:MAG TPA: isoprenylcysteine carboxylmethyltransferase family protein [Bryobacteraceae bacterium]|nr:isoprenylcysteine carboxylmethyltransferase family protein [Bryobacteraceae bacterium]
MNPFRYINAAWIVAGIVWVIGAATAKPTARRESYRSRVLYTCILVAAFLLLFRKGLPFPVLEERFVPATPAAAWVGLALTILGIVFAIWARFYLGGNWSGMVTVKENHQLVRSGPYAIVRHPIYTGFSLAVLGTALAVGEIRGLIALALVATGLRMKSRIEEAFMDEQFGSRYREYQREVKALIPFVW